MACQTTSRVCPSWLAWPNIISPATEPNRKTYAPGPSGMMALKSCETLQNMGAEGSLPCKPFPSQDSKVMGFIVRCSAHADTSDSSPCSKLWPRLEVNPGHVVPKSSMSLSGGPALGLCRSSDTHVTRLLVWREAQAHHMQPAEQSGSMHKRNLNFSSGTLKFQVGPRSNAVGCRWTSS